MKYTGRHLFRPAPKPEPKETCTEAMDRIARETPCTRMEITSRCGNSGDFTERVNAWLACSFEHPENIQIERMRILA